MKTAKATTRMDINEAISASADTPIEQQRGFLLETEVVYREKVKIPFTDTGTDTIGDMIDRHIAGLAKHDGEMRHFAITFDDDSWNDAKEAYKNWEPMPRY